jgi:hypothetical protein
MSRLRGMTLKQFYDVLEEMHTIYPFESDKTYIGNIIDLPSDSPLNVEILTKDEKTGVQIIMSKSVCYRIGDDV